jgi:hypothetical protein
MTSFKKNFEKKQELRSMSETVEEIPKKRKIEKNPSQEKSEIGDQTTNGDSVKNEPTEAPQNSLKSEITQDTSSSIPESSVEGSTRRR